VLAAIEGVVFMNVQNSSGQGTTIQLSHELYFTSMCHAGRGLVIPCDETGRVDLDSLTERLRNSYFAARAMIGREYLYPTLQRAH
jgi:hypothetical protein